jgi:hypothetical protein
VTAIAYIGTDDTVQDLVDAFHHDPSSNARSEKLRALRSIVLGAIVTSRP